MRAAARVISYIFHPLFVLSYALLLLVSVNPFLFGANSFSAVLSGNARIIFIQIFILTIFLPALMVGMMKGLELISSIHLHDKQERIGPYIAAIVCYAWTFVNLLWIDDIPRDFTVFTLGATLSLMLAFVINIFSKISMHTIGMGGLVAMILIIMLGSSYVNLEYVFLLSVVCAGAVGSARLYLQAHESNEIFGGYAVGFLMQFCALMIYPWVSQIVA